MDRHVLLERSYLLCLVSSDDKERRARTAIAPRKPIFCFVLALEPMNVLALYGRDVLVETLATAVLIEYLPPAPLLASL